MIFPSLRKSIASSLNHGGNANTSPRPSQLQFLRGEWHIGRKLVWWLVSMEMFGIGTRIAEKMEEAEKAWEREERERERLERLARLGG